MKATLTSKSWYFPFWCLVLWSFAKSKIIKFIGTKKKTNLFKVVDCIGSTKKRYIRSYNKFIKDPGDIQQLPPLKSLLSKVKSSNCFSIRTLNTATYKYQSSLLLDSSKTKQELLRGASEIVQLNQFVSSLNISMAI